MLIKLLRFFTPFKNRQQDLMIERHSYSKKQFISFFSDMSVDIKISEFVWERLESEASIIDFKPAPEDDTAFIFGIVDEDFEDLVEETINRSDRIVPSREECKEMKPIGTVSDLVLFVSTCNAKQG